MKEIPVVAYKCDYKTIELTGAVEEVVGDFFRKAGLWILHCSEINLIKIAKLNDMLITYHFVFLRRI